MNNYQSKIRTAIQQASGSIKVAVAWFTDPVLVEELKQKAQQRVNVEVIMSADEWNALRFYEFKGLKNYGAKIRTYGGSSENGVDIFMHCKFCVIDREVILEGSNNWTISAQSNIEQCRVEKDSGRAIDLLYLFDRLMRGSNDYFSSMTDPDAIIKKLEPLENKKIQPDARVRYDYERKLETAALINTGTAVTTSTGNIIGSSTAGTVTKTGTAMAADTGNTITSSKEQGKGGVTKNRSHRFYGGHKTPYYFPKEKFKNEFPFALYQKAAIEKTYDFLRCKVDNGQLICTGDLQPDGCEKYSIRIEFQAGRTPAVFITSHDIEPSNEIHIYKDGSLCLFYPGDLKWKNNLRISEYIIPWVAEWIVFYELWLMTGKWMGAEAPHSIPEA